MAALTSSELFATLRKPTIDRLVELRVALDESYLAVSEADAADRFELLWERYAGYLRDGDVDRQRRFVRRWLALRLGEGRSPESVMHALVTAGDVLVQVTRSELPPTEDTLELVRELQRMTYVTSRSVVAVLAEDLERKSTLPLETSASKDEGPQ